LAEDIVFFMKSQSKKKDDEAPWNVEFSKNADNEGKEHYGV